MAIRRLIGAVGIGAVGLCAGALQHGHALCRDDPSSLAPSRSAPARFTGKTFVVTGGTSGVVSASPFSA